MTAMTEIEQKALALWNTVRSKNHEPPLGDKRAALLCSPSGWEAINTAIEQHEQFKREVSDAIIDCGAERYLGRFILPKPDPLVEAIDDLKDGRAGGTTESYAACLRVAIEARGGRIVWEGE